MQDQVIGYDAQGKPITAKPSGYDSSGKPIYVNDGATETINTDPKTLRLRSFASMVGAPIDTQTGKRFGPKISAPPRGTLPVLAGLVAAAASSGLSIPASAAIAGLSGGAAEGADALMHGEKPTLGSMAMEGAEQFAMQRAPQAVANKLIPAGMKAVKAASMSKAEQIARPTVGAADMITDAIKGAPIIGGDVTLNNIGHALYGTGQKIASKAREIPQALRNMQLIYRVLANRNKQ